MVEMPSEAEIRQPTPSPEQLAALERLVDLARSEQSLEDVPGMVLGELVALFQPSVACVYVRSPSHDRHQAVARYPDSFWTDETRSKPFLNWSERRGAVGRAFRERVPVFSENVFGVPERSDYVPFSAQVRSEIVIPVFALDALAIHEVAVAAVVIARSDADVISVTDRWLSRMAQATLTAIYNRSIARERRDHRLEFLRGVTDFTEENLDSLFSRFLQALATLVPARFLSLWLYHEPDDVLVLRSFFPLSLNGTQIRFDIFDTPVLDCRQCPTGKVVHDKRPAIIPNAGVTKGFSNRKFAQRFGLRWFLSCPIINAEGDTLGVVNIWPDAPLEEFDQEILAALLDYIRPAAATIRLSELLMSESLLEQLDAIQALLFSFDDKQSDWDSLAAVVRDVMRCEGCSFFLLNDDNLLTLRGTTGMGVTQPYKSIIYAPGEGLTGYALLQPRAVPYYPELRNAASDSHVSKYREKTRRKSKSILLGQLRAPSGDAIGVIRCTNKEEAPGRGIGRFTTADVILLDRIARLVSHFHARALSVRAHEEERMQRVNSLHHEILSPVEAFASHTEWLERHFDAHSNTGAPLAFEAIARKFSDMRQNAQLIDVLVTTMGRYDRDLSLNIALVPLRGLIEVCKGFLIHEARRKGIDVGVGHLAVRDIRADRIHLMRVFYNLMRNALKYYDKRELVPYIQLTASRAGETTVVCVQDNGIGVPEGEEEAIFRQFGRGSNAATVFPEGTGLGLYYCRSVMAAHYGSISLMNRAKPTVFALELPFR